MEPPSRALPKRERIAKRADFLEIYEKGRKQFSRFVVVFAADNALGHPRIGITATKKLGKSNVRNRFRRWVRETYRTNRHGLGLEACSIDVVVNIKPSAASASFEEFSKDLVRALGRLAGTPRP